MSLLSKLFQKWQKPQTMDAKLVLLGSSGAGKTTLVKFLENGQPVEEDPRTTLGIDIRANPIRIDGWEFTAIDIGGQTLYQKTFWNLGVAQADAIIYLFDGTIKPENSQFGENLKQFEYMLNLVEEEMPIMILINKQDLVAKQPLSAEEASALIGLDKLTNRSITFIPTSAKFGEGVETAMHWMIEKLNDLHKN